MAHSFRHGQYIPWKGSMICTVVLLESLGSNGVAKLSGSHVMKKYLWINMWQKLHSYSGTPKWQKTLAHPKKNWLMTVLKPQPLSHFLLIFVWKIFTLLLNLPITKHNPEKELLLGPKMLETSMCQEMGFMCHGSRLKNGILRCQSRLRHCMGGQMP